MREDKYFVVARRSARYASYRLQTIPFAHPTVRRPYYTNARGDAKRTIKKRYVAQMREAAGQVLDDPRLLTILCSQAQPHLNLERLLL